MAALANDNPSLLDLAKLMDPDGSIAYVAEVLDNELGLLSFMTWQEGNLVTGHRHVVRTGIPTPTWRKLYGYVAPQKSTTETVTDNTGELVAYSQVDIALAKLSGNVGAFMMSEAKPQIQGLRQELESTLWYGNEGTEPEAFTGLGPRFNSTTAANGENVILGGGAGTDNASIWLVVFGPDTVFGIVPKGSTAGLSVEDKGRQTLSDSNGGRLEVYEQRFGWDAGLCVKDWRGVVRIANIDRSLLLAAGTGTSAVLPDLMFQATEMVPEGILNSGRAAFFMDRSIRTKLRQQLSAKVASSTLSFTEVGGRRVMDFQGIPIVVSDALRADESLIA